MLSTFAYEAAGALRIRHSLRPLYLRDVTLQNLGASRRENAEACAGGRLEPSRRPAIGIVAAGDRIRSSVQEKRDGTQIFQENAKLGGARHEEAQGRNVEERPFGTQGQEP